MNDSERGSIEVDLSEVVKALGDQVERLSKASDEDLSDKGKRDRIELMNALQGMNDVLAVICRQFGAQRNYIGCPREPAPKFNIE